MKVREYRKKTLIDPVMNPMDVLHYRVQVGMTPWERLAFAIVVMGANDYCEAKIQQRREGLPNPKTQAKIDECLDFFYSDWFAALTKLHPDVLVRRLDREVKENDTKTVSRAGAGSARARRAADYGL